MEGEWKLSACGHFCALYVRVCESLVVRRRFQINKVIASLIMTQDVGVTVTNGIAAIYTRWGRFKPQVMVNALRTKNVVF